MKEDNNKKIIAVLDEISQRILFYSNHAYEEPRRIPANALIWLAMNINLLEKHIDQLKNKLKESSISEEVELDKVTNILPGDSEFLEAAEDVIIYLDEFAGSGGATKH